MCSRGTPTVYRNVLLTVSLPLLIGCVPIDSSSMHDASKTEVLWCASARRQSQLPSDPLAVGSDLVLPVSCVRDLGFH